MQLKNKPYNVLLIAAIALFLSSFFISNNVLDIHLHDTYFIIAKKYIFWMLAFVSTIIWAIYKLTDKLLYSKSLIWIHAIATILTIALILLYLHSENQITTARKYYDFSSWELNTFFDDKFIFWLKALLGITILCQLVFFINLILGVIKRK